MKVAVCISGEMRLFNHPLIIQGYKKFIEKYNPDVFISTWDHIGLSMNHGYLDPFQKKQVSQGLETIIQQTYVGCKSIEIENYNDWIDAVDTEANSILTDPRYNTRTINSYSQLYKIHKANQLKLTQESLNGYKYDIVIRLRPDNLFISGLQIEQTTPNTVYNINLKGNFYPNRVYDILFYGDSSSMDIISDAYLQYKQLIQNDFENGLCRRDACRLLYLKAILGDVQVESTTNRPCDIYRGQTFEEYSNILHSLGGLD
jgi:hypothetical protein